MNQQRVVNKTAKRNVTSTAIRIWNCVGVIGIAGTLVSVFSGWFWIADLFAQLNVQFVVLMLATLPLWAYRRRRKTLFLAGCALAWNLFIMAPYFLPPETGPGDRNFELVLFNVLRTNDAVAKTLDEAIRDEPDFLFLMETSPRWDEPLRQLERIYPYQKRICREDYTGVAFLSKHPWQRLDVPNVSGANPPIDVQFAVDAVNFRLILTHPLPPISPGLAESRDEQLTKLAKTVTHSLPTLLAGDFNLTPWSARFRELLGAGVLHDLSRGFGLAPTLTPLPTWFGGVKVDHALGNAGLGALDFQVGQTEFSDHRPVLVRFFVRSLSQ